MTVHLKDKSTMLEGKTKDIAVILRLCLFFYLFTSISTTLIEIASSDGNKQAE